MKKLLILFLLLFTTDSFASGISGNVTSAPCDSATLSKYTGTANVEINWEPNVINLKWYNDDTEINVASASQTCTYDGMITVPPAPPQKLGYTFNGWKIPKMDFGTIPTNVDSSERWAIGVAYWDGSDYCWYDNTRYAAWRVACDSDDNYSELQRYEWKVKYIHGYLYGTSECSTTSGTYAQHGTPETGIGKYCWCKATGYKEINTNLIKMPLFTLFWTFVSDYTSVDNCEMTCATACADAVEKNQRFRTALCSSANN